MQNLTFSNREPLSVDKIEDTNTIILDGMYFGISPVGDKANSPAVFIFTGEGTSKYKKKFSLSVKKKGIPYKVLEIIEDMKSNWPLCNNIIIFGDNPLEQPNIMELLRVLEVGNYKVTVVSKGSSDIKNYLSLRNISYNINILMPSSKKENSNFLGSLPFLREIDYLTFECNTKEDFDFAVTVLTAKNTRANIVFTPGEYLKHREELIIWIMQADILLRKYYNQIGKLNYVEPLHVVLEPDLSKTEEEVPPAPETPQEELPVKLQDTEEVDDTPVKSVKKTKLSNYLNDLKKK